MAGFAAGSDAEPVSTLAVFEVVRRNCRPTVSRWMPSSRAIRRWDQPCAAKVILDRDTRFNLERTLRLRPPGDGREGATCAAAWEIHACAAK